MTEAMTTVTRTGTRGADRPPLLTRALLLRCVSIVGCSSGFFLLLAVVPLYAGEHGGGGAAGLATGALMAATVAGELATPRLVARLGYRWTLGGGLVLLGAPALVLTVSGSVGWIVAVSVLRGLGFALAVVAGGALTAALIPPGRRGEGLALIGVVGGVPGMLALPLGVWLAGRVGVTPVAVAAGAVVLAAVVTVPGLPDRAATATGDKSVGVVAGLRTPALAGPALVFAASALAAGVIPTFLPAAVPAGSGTLVALALLLQPAASTAVRWWAGRYGDRHGPARLVLPGLLLSAAGMALTALTASPAAVLGGVTLFGVGFGIAQSATLTLMYARVEASSQATVSALWNLAYDAGMGAGALLAAPVVAALGHPAAFALTAAVTATAVVPAVRDRRRFTQPVDSRTAAQGRTAA
ncbi:MFS transporter [Streptomyces sp. NPDC051940]|uniref:MFS transporter n=1 Tax=Streptomyces sp. NPDC051940 TaxID=3155675 RepID=UPI00341B91F5